MFKIEVDTKKLGGLILKMTPAMRPVVIDAMDHASRKFMQYILRERMSAQPWFRSSPESGVVKSPKGFFRGLKRMMVDESGKGGLGVIVYTQSKTARKLETGYTAQGGSDGVPVPLAFEGRVLNAIGRPEKTKSFAYLSKLKSVVRMVFKGQVYLTRVFKNSRQVLPLFVFKKKVTVPAHLQYYETFNRHRSELYQIIAKDITRGMKAAWQNG